MAIYDPYISFCFFLLIAADTISIINTSRLPIAKRATATKNSNRLNIGAG
jgi:hypothetical protein